MFTGIDPTASVHGGCLRGTIVEIGRLAIGIHLESPQPDLERQIADLYGLYPRRDPNTLPDATISLSSENRGIMRHRQALRAFADDHAPYPAVPVRWAVPVIEATINWFVWRRVARVLLLHAAVVERDGRALVLSGPSGVGKSTLCVALVARGWRFLTDEIGMVSLHGGRLEPHPRPISLKNAAIEIAAGMLPDAHLTRSLANAVQDEVAFMRPPTRSIERAGETAAPALVIFPRYRPDAGLECQPVEKAQAFARLIESSANYLTLLETGFETLADLVEACDHYTLIYQSLDDAVAVIEDLEPAARGIEKIA